MEQGIVITGVTGFVGSHLAATMLLKNDDAKLICLAREKDGESAEQRVLGALNRACVEQGCDFDAERWRERLTTFEVDLCNQASPINRTAMRQLANYDIIEFWHCAASTKFNEANGDGIWRANVEGVRTALSMAAGLGADEFNHVSTAYTCGKTSGRIFERLHGGCIFNNRYEQSKAAAEVLVVDRCTESNMRYRIFRPSIVIGHSVTYRCFLNAGLYQAINATRSVQARVLRRDPDYFTRQPLRVIVDRNATMHLIPVDMVIAEMMDLSELGDATLDQVFHIVSVSPISTYDLFQTAMPMLNINVTMEVAADQFTFFDRAFNGILREFLPYLHSRKVFDRTNVEREGVDCHQVNCPFDVDRLSRFIAWSIQTNENQNQPSRSDRLVETSIG